MELPDEMVDVTVSAGFGGIGYACALTKKKLGFVYSHVDHVLCGRDIIQGAIDRIYAGFTDADAAGNIFDTPVSFWKGVHFQVQRLETVHDAYVRRDSNSLWETAGNQDEELFCFDVDKAIPPEVPRVEFIFEIFDDRRDFFVVYRLV